MNARDDLYLFAMVGKVKDDSNSQMAVRKLNAYQEEILAKAKLSAELAEEDYRRVVRAASQLEKNLRARVAELEAERHSTNEALSDAAVQLRVQRDRIAELETAAVCPSVARLHGSKCVLPVRHGGDHRNETKRHYWSDEYAASVPQPRQAEDPHDSPLHHDYADSRDLPTFPQQQDRRAM